MKCKTTLSTVLFTRMPHINYECLSVKCIILYEYTIILTKCIQKLLKLN
jgi:hypothetical protein